MLLARVLRLSLDGRRSPVSEGLTGSVRRLLQPGSLLLLVVVVLFCSINIKNKIMRWHSKAKRSTRR